MAVGQYQTRTATLSAPGVSSGDLQLSVSCTGSSTSSPDEDFLDVNLSIDGVTLEIEGGGSGCINA